MKKNDEAPRRLFNIYGDYGTGFAGNVYDPHHICPTLQTMQGGGRQPMIITGAAIRKRDNGQTLEVNGGEYANAITTVQKDSLVNENMRIRKLTPKECWRLMGFSDEEYESAEIVCSDTQLYKQAGNSIVVQVLESLIRQMLPEEREKE